MKRLYGIAIVVAGLALFSVPAGADVLCRNKKGVLASRSGCKGKETHVDPAALGLVGPPGQKGDKGDTGAAGPGARWALVSSAGSVIAQSGGISVDSPAVGTYLVNFGSSLAGKTVMATAACLDSECPFVGTISAGICGGGAAGLTCTMSNTNSSVDVGVSDPTNSSFMDAPFFVAAF